MSLAPHKQNAEIVGIIIPKPITKSYHTVEMYVSFDVDVADSRFFFLLPLRAENEMKWRTLREKASISSNSIIHSVVRCAKNQRQTSSIGAQAQKSTHKSQICIENYHMNTTNLHSVNNSENRT